MLNRKNRIVKGKFELFFVNSTEKIWALIGLDWFIFSCLNEFKGQGVRG